MRNSPNACMASQGAATRLLHWQYSSARVDQLIGSFRDRISAVLGYAPAEISIGTFTRFSTSVSRADTAGWCILYEELNGGTFGCWRREIRGTWKAERTPAIPQQHRMLLAQERRAATAKRNAEQRQMWVANALHIEKLWSQCVPLEKGDPCHRYLMRRGLADVWPLPQVLRLHRALPYWHGAEKLGVFATMVAPIVGPDGLTVALHRTYLTKDGRKADVPSPKKVTRTAGPLAGACVPLGSLTGDCIGIAEGIETALAAWRAFGVPTVASYCARNLAAWQWPAGLQRLVIFADADKAGREAADTLSRRAQAARLQCEVLIPTREGADWCDVWAERGAVGEQA